MTVNGFSGKHSSGQCRWEWQVVCVGGVRVQLLLGLYQLTMFVIDGLFF